MDDKLVKEEIISLIQKKNKNEVVFSGTKVTDNGEIIQVSYNVDDFDKEIDLAAKCLLDRNIKIIYPLDEIGTKVVREAMGINDEMKPKTYEEIGALLGNSASKTGITFNSSIRLLTSRIIEVKYLLSICKSDISEEEQKLIFINPNLNKYNLEKIWEELKDKTSLIMEEKRVPMLLEELELSARAFICLRRTEITSVEELIKIPTSELRKIHNLGNRASQEVVDKVHSFGFKFTDEVLEEKELSDNVNLKTLTQERNGLISQDDRLTSEKDALLKIKSELVSSTIARVKIKKK